jgi:hypothetical protein
MVLFSIWRWGGGRKIIGVLGEGHSVIGKEGSPTNGLGISQTSPCPALRASLEACFSHPVFNGNTQYLILPAAEGAVAGLLFLQWTEASEQGCYPAIFLIYRINVTGLTMFFLILLILLLANIPFIC